MPQEQRRSLTIIIPPLVAREARKKRVALDQFVSFLLTNLCDNPEFIQTGAEIVKGLNQEAA